METYPVQVRFAVHWGEMDAMNHVNNVRFFRWFETARIALFQQLGIEADPAAGIAPILASTSCDYLKPVVWPADITVGIKVTRIGRTSFACEYGVFVGDGSDTQVARGTSVVVLFDYESGEKVLIPDGLRAGLTDLLDED